MEFDRAFLSGPSCPRKYRQTQRHHTRVDAEQSVTETKPRLHPQLGSTTAQRPVIHALEQLPWPMTVGIGQRRSTRRFYSPLFEPSLTTGQPSGDFPQRLGIRQLAIQ